MAQTTQAPGELELVRAFVNTRDVDLGTDAFATVPGLIGWLRDAGLLSPAGGDPAASEQDRKLAVGLRDALRALMLANNDGRAIGSDALDALERVARASVVAVSVAPDGRLSLGVNEQSVRGALSRLLLIVERAMADGAWQRLKACRDDTCQWGFYDHSKNRSRAWCSMDVCGSRNKAREYRRRQSSHETHH